MFNLGRLPVLYRLRFLKSVFSLARQEPPFPPYFDAMRFRLHDFLLDTKKKWQNIDRRPSVTLSIVLFRNCQNLWLLVSVRDTVNNIKTPHARPAGAS